LQESLLRWKLCRLTFVLLPPLLLLVINSPLLLIFEAQLKAMGALINCDRLLVAGCWLLLLLLLLLLHVSLLFYSRM